MMRPTSRSIAVAMFLAVAGLVVVWAVGGTRPPCQRKTLTDPCVDDVVAWDAVPGAVSYHVEGWIFTPDASGKLWDADTVTASYPVGCTFNDQYLFVWAENSAGRSVDPAVIYWAAGGGKMLDDTNGAGPWVGELMCGGA